MSSERFEVVIVGAGLSGIAAALTLARAEVEVLVIERGDFPGAKNLFGGILYSGVLAELIPVSVHRMGPLDYSRRGCASTTYTAPPPLPIMSNLDTV